MTMQRKLAHFELVRELGKGGMGIVYLAQDTELNRRVAIKVLLPDQLRDPEMIRRLEREAKMVAALNHPNIVTIHQFGEEDGAHFLVMEYIEGETLRNRTPANGLGLPELLKIAIPLVEALEAAHHAGVIHRDLKPGNIMVTGDGRVKVLDFGLAKPTVGSEVHQEEDGEPITRLGDFVGTLDYLSPEQLQGEPADSRSDIFACGIILQEIASGVRPFVAASKVDLIFSILRDKPALISEVRPDLPAALGEIVARCLEKKPEDRFQTAKELKERLYDLASNPSSASSLAPSGEAHPGEAPNRKGLIGKLSVAMVVAALAVGGYFAVFRGGQEPAPNAVSVPPPAETARPTLGVLQFQNLSSDAELDWLTRGLVEMLVTDLSQEAHFELLSTDRLHQILKESGHLAEKILSRDAVKAVAERAQVDNVVLGRFARVGEVLQISVTIQEAATGKILAGGQARGTDDSAIFSMVDELSRTIRRHFDAESTESGTELAEVTTASIDAYRLYLESVNFHMQADFGQAIASAEKAVEIDPGFGLALARLGHIYENLGQTDKAHDYITRALEYGDRLPPAERAYIEGLLLVRHWSTMSQGVESYRRALEIDPDQSSARYSLAVTYGYLERYGESIAELEELARRGVPKAAADHSHANMLAALGRFEEGEEILQKFVREAPDSWFGSLSLGWHYTNWTKLDLAAKYYDEVETLSGGNAVLDQARWMTLVQAEDWPRAAGVADRLVEAEAQIWQWRGFLSRAFLALYRGVPDEALPEFEKAARVYQGTGAYAAAARAWAASAQLLLEKQEDALRLASEGLQQGVGEWTELESLHLISLSEAAKGDWDSSTRRADELRGRLDLSDNVQLRLGHWLDGTLNLQRGDPSAAAEALEEAARTLPPRGIKWHHLKRADHVPIWFALGRSHLEAGRPEEAARWFDRVIESGIEHIEFPVRYVRSFFYLGQIHSGRGNVDVARQHYSRFLSFWEDGVVDRDRVESARAYLQR